jgi:hypothetical protein
MDAYSHADTVRTSCVTATSNIHFQQRTLLFRRALTFMSIPPSFVNPWPLITHISPNNTLNMLYLMIARLQGCSTPDAAHQHRTLRTRSAMHTCIRHTDRQCSSTNNFTRQRCCTTVYTILSCFVLPYVFVTVIGNLSDLFQRAFSSDD